MRNIAIKHKLISIIMATCLAVLLLASVIQLLFERGEYREETIDSISCYAEMIGDNCRAALAFEDAEDVEETLKSLKAESSIVFACVYTKEAKVLAHYQHPGLTDNLSPPVCQIEGYHFENDYFKLFKQINENDETIGTVYIQLDLSQMKTTLWFKAGTIGMVVLVCTLIAYLVSLRLQRVISGPILSLAEVARAVSEKKDYSTRAPKQNNNDEVGSLIDAFNEMLEQIQQRDSELSKAKSKLEARVKERTVELTHVNEQLTREVDERKNIETALRKSEERFRQVVENAGDWIWEVNVEGLYTYASPIVERVLGYKPEEIVGKRYFYDFFAPDVKEELKKAALEAFTKRESFKGFVNPNIHKNGSSVIMETSGTPIIDEKGNLCGFRGADKDITERKKAETALKESEGKLKSIIENSSDQIFMLDKDYKFLSINKTAADLANKSPQEMIDKSIFEIYPENIAAEFSKNIKNVFDTGKNISIEEKMVLQGREFYNSTSLNPVKDNKEGVIAVTGIVRDVTKFKQAEEALRTNEARLSNAMKIAHLGYWEYDVADDRFTFNDYFYDIFHTTAEQVGGYKMKPARYAELFLHPDDRQVVAIEMKKALETNDPQYNRQLEHRIVYATGETGYISVRFFIVKDKQGRTIKTFGANQDITDRKRAEIELKNTHEKLLETSHMAGMAEVAADVLHNVGNVLNSINVSTTVITEKVSESEVANLEKLANIVNDHIEDLGTFLTEHPQGKHIPVYLTEVSKILIVEQAETISRLQVLSDNVQHIKDIISTQQSYAKVSGVEVTTSITGLVEDAIQINSAGLQRHGTRLIREFEELPDVEIDKQKVLQILVNLISNAKYASSSSEKEEKIITIRIYKHVEDRFRIVVADNGVGISKENLTRIFSHGFTTKKHGHGFGLHSSALASKDIGGSLAVHSDGVGQGATFTLELPLKPAEIIK